MLEVWDEGPLLRAVRLSELPPYRAGQALKIEHEGASAYFALATGYGTSGQANIHPTAYNNPIFVDADGAGFTPNGDTLGWPLPVKKPDVAAIKRQLEAIAPPPVPSGAR